MAKRNGRSRSRLGSVTFVLVALVAGFCVLTSWQDKTGHDALLSDFEVLSTDVFAEILDRFGSLEKDADDGSREAPAATGELEGAELSVHFLDVGQAESILIKGPEANVLIDAGEKNNGDQVVRYLKQNDVTRLDYVIATHPHADHIGGMDTVLDVMRVETIIMPNLPDELVPTTQTYTDLLLAIEKNGAKPVYATPGNTCDLGGGSELTIFGPGAEYADLNNMSVMCRLEYGDTSFFFTGDAEAAAEGGALDYSRGVTSDVLSVGHHGSNTSSSEEFLDAVSPRIAVISCGTDNSYGHPHREVIEALTARNARILRTDLNGTVVIESNGKRLSVTTERE